MDERDKEEWHSVLPQSYPDQIEWSKTGKVRARRKGEISWIYGHATNAQYAYSMGQELLRRKR